MFDFASFLIASAHAANEAVPAAASVGGESGSVLMRFMPLFLIFFVFYILLIRPQQKKADAQMAMLKVLKKGDKVITSSGLVGVVTKLLDDDYVMLEIAKGVEVKLVRSTISGLMDETKPANENKGK